MKKASIAPVVALSLLIVFASVAIAEKAGEKWDKTVTLASGEVILDMSGEWSSLYEFYGVLNNLEPVKDILTITQEGNTFTAVKQIGSEHVPKGSETIRGILDKDGFKEFEIYRMETWAPCMCEISEKGNKIVFSDGRMIQGTLTRKR